MFVQSLEEGHVCNAGCEVKGCAAVSILQGGVCPCLQQQAHNVMMPIF